jgi:hypothetical protein
MRVEAIESDEFPVAEVAFVRLAVPCSLVGHVLDTGRAPGVSKYGPPRDQVVWVFGSHQPVHPISVDVEPVTVAALDVVCDCCGVCVRQVAEGALDRAAAVGVRVEMLKRLRSR